LSCTRCLGFGVTRASTVRRIIGDEVPSTIAQIDILPNFSQHDDLEAVGCISRLGLPKNIGTSSTIIWQLVASERLGGINQQSIKGGLDGFKIPRESSGLLVDFANFHVGWITCTPSAIVGHEFLSAGIVVHHALVACCGVWKILANEPLEFLTFLCFEAGVGVDAFHQDFEATIGDVRIYILDCRT